MPTVDHRDPADRREPRARPRQHITAWMMRHIARRYDDVLSDRKRTLFGALRGTVLELGPGTGTSLRFFDPSVQWIGVEPNPAMRELLRREADRLGRRIDLRDGRAEQTGMPDASVDAVVSSLVMCGVPDVDATLAEVLRVLRPGGTFAVLEHVAAPPGTALRAVQHACSRPWRLMFDGCHPDRDTGVSIERAGFVDIALERIDGPVPIPIVRPHVIGTARKPSVGERSAGT